MQPRRHTYQRRPTLRLFATTLWEYASQHYDAADGSREQGSKHYAGATPSWVIWQLLQRYTREGDTVLDPMVGSGTTIDVCNDLARKPIGFDLAPSRSDIQQADARHIPLDNNSVDFAFIDPPYSTHIDYSDDERCIGKLDAGGQDHGTQYYKAMEQVIAELDRVLIPRRYMALYVSDSWRKRKGKNKPKSEQAGSVLGGQFMPIGFELFARLRTHFDPVDIIAVNRKNAKLDKGNWRKAAIEQNFYMRGFNYLFIMKKP
ncbi:MAG: DNA methyltransferase [Planctomycetota bacterium]